MSFLNKIAESQTKKKASGNSSSLKNSLSAKPSISKSSHNIKKNSVKKSSGPQSPSFSAKSPPPKQKKETHNGSNVFIKKLQGFKIELLPEDKYIPPTREIRELIQRAASIHGVKGIFWKTILNYPEIKRQLGALEQK